MSRRRATFDELASELASILRLFDYSFDQITGTVISSSVPELGRQWLLFTQNYLQHDGLVVGQGIKTGMAIRTDSPPELGADRLVNAVSAFEQYAGPLVVVDFGTAITFDVVSRDGAYLGGLIAPGVRISLEALENSAAKLPRVEISEKPSALIGKNTVDAIKAGLIYGFAGCVDGVMQRLNDQLAEQVNAVATGGYCELIVPHCQLLHEMDRQLTLKGLKIIHERNIN